MGETISIDTFRPQERNLNRHTQRGMGELETSVQRDGWIGALTVAADGEVFDGSARIEVAATTGFEDAIVVESDGSRPIIVKRTDIPNAQDERAIRLGIAANRVAELNLDWDAEAIAGMVGDGFDFGSLMDDGELAEIINGVTAPEFKEYTEAVEDEVKYHECPECHHKFPA